MSIDVQYNISVSSESSREVWKLQRGLKKSGSSAYVWGSVGAGCLAEDVGSWLASWLAEVTAGEESGGLEADRTSTPSDLPSKNQKNLKNQQQNIKTF